MNLLNFIQRMNQAGMAINTVYDIGAWNGDWSRHHKQVLPASEFILFEANPAYGNILANSGFKAFNTVLSNPGREYVEFFNGTNTGDSYYKETTAHYDNQGSIRLPCTTLDNLVRDYNLAIPNFIKIDTQGSELDILSGASFLDRVDMIYTECPIVCYNKGAPNIQDYLDFFKQRNFVPIDVFEIHRGEETLIQLDIMFMKYETKERYLGPNNLIRPFA
jgi:FkbM family methyltransferase